MPTIADKRRAYRDLHQSGCFVLPNPWRHRHRALFAAPRIPGHRDDERRICLQ
jgi:hypothetical protein